MSDFSRSSSKASHHSDAVVEEDLDAAGHHHHHHHHRLLQPQSAPPVVAIPDSSAWNGLSGAAGATDSDPANPLAGLPPSSMSVESALEDLVVVDFKNQQQPADHDSSGGVVVDRATTPDRGASPQGADHGVQDDDPDDTLGGGNKSPTSDDTSEQDKEDKKPSSSSSSPSSFWSSCCRRSTRRKMKRLLKLTRGDMPGLRDIITGHQLALEHGGSPNWLVVVLLTLVSQLDIALRGLSQVYLVSNSISGLIIFVALALSTDPLRCIYALLGSLASTSGGSFAASGALFATTAELEKSELAAGLYGYDGVLVALAVSIFVRPSSITVASPPPPSSSAVAGTTIVTLLVLCFTAGVLRKAFGRFFLAAWSIPAFTFTFNFTALALLFGIQSGGVAVLCFNNDAALAVDNDNTFACNLFSNTTSTNSTSSSSRSIPINDVETWMNAFFIGIGQLTFADTLVGGVLVFVALAWSNVAIAIQALGGSVMSSAVSFGLAGVTSASNAATAALNSGLFGYNSVGTAIVVFGASSTHSERVQLASLFRQLDTDNSGTLSSPEVKIFLETVLQTFAAEEARKSRAVLVKSRRHSLVIGAAAKTEDAAAVSDNDDDDARSLETYNDEEPFIIPDEDFLEFWEEIPKTDPEHLSFDEFSRWFSSLAQEDGDGDGGDDDDDAHADGAKAQQPINLMLRREASWPVRLLEAAFFIFLTVFVAAPIAAWTKPFPVFTLPFCVASWLRKLSQDTSLSKTRKPAVEAQRQKMQEHLGSNGGGGGSRNLSAAGGAEHKNGADGDAAAAFACRDSSPLSSPLASSTASAFGRNSSRVAELLRGLSPGKSVSATAAAASRDD